MRLLFQKKSFEGVGGGFFQNHIVQWLLAFAFLLNAVLWALCGFFFHDRGEMVLMRYNAYLGIDPASGGPWYAPYRIPFISFVFLWIATVLSWRFFLQKDRVVAHLMLLCGVVVQIFSMIALVSIILINRV